MGTGLGRRRRPRLRSPSPRAVPADRNRSRIGGMVMAELQQKPVGGDDLPLVVLLERPVAAVGRGAVWEQDLGRSRCPGRRCQGVVSLLDVARVKMRATATGRAPVPKLQAVGIWVCWEDWAPGWRMVW